MFQSFFQLQKASEEKDEAVQPTSSSVLENEMIGDHGDPVLIPFQVVCTTSLLPAQPLLQTNRLLGEEDSTPNMFDPGCLSAEVAGHK